MHVTDVKLIFLLIFCYWSICLILRCTNISTKPRYTAFPMRNCNVILHHPVYTMYAVCWLNFSDALVCVLKGNYKRTTERVAITCVTTLTSPSTFSEELRTRDLFFCYVTGIPRWHLQTAYWHSAASESCLNASFTGLRLASSMHAQRPHCSGFDRRELPLIISTTAVYMHTLPLPAFIEKVIEPL